MAWREWLHCPIGQLDRNGWYDSPTKAREGAIRNFQKFCHGFRLAYWNRTRESPSLTTYGSTKYVLIWYLKFTDHLVPYCSTIVTLWDRLQPRVPIFFPVAIFPLLRRDSNRTPNFTDANTVSISSSCQKKIVNVIFFSDGSLFQAYLLIASIFDFRWPKIWYLWISLSTAIYYWFLHEKREVSPIIHQSLFCSMRVILSRLHPHPSPFHCNHIKEVVDPMVSGLLYALTVFSS